MRCGAKWMKIIIEQKLRSLKLLPPVSDQFKLYFFLFCFTSLFATIIAFSGSKSKILKSLDVKSRRVQKKVI